jgi:hypothetical protein
MSALTLTISDTAIRFDDSGRFCLNDLHKAAGNEKRHSPNYWLETQQTQELIEELKTTGIPVVSLTGRKGGTYAVKELVYAYAMWISAKFHIAVIRAYDALVTGTLPPQAPESKTRKALPGGLSLDQQDTIKALVKQRVESELPQEKWAGASIKCWSALKKKFGCSYKEISPDNFVNAVSLISRLTLEGELLEKSTPEPMMSRGDVEAMISQRLQSLALPPKLQHNNQVLKFAMTMSLDFNGLIDGLERYGYRVIKLRDDAGTLDA